MTFSSRSCGALAAVLLCAAVVTPAVADERQEQLLVDFVHYLRIAKPDMAADNGQALLDSGITDAELALMIDDLDLNDRWEDILARGVRRIAGLGDLVAEIEGKIESGRLDLARDPERIAAAIDMLNGTLRQRLMARNRLLRAGEYAVPQLLEVMVKRGNPDLEIASMEMLVQIGRQAVTPLCEALPGLDPQSQRKTCDMLREINWPHAQPYLLQLAQTVNNGEVSQAAQRAFQALGGADTDLSNQFTSLAGRYFDEEQSLVAFPLEDENNVWAFDSHIGLHYRSVPTAVYGDIMAMRLSQNALSHNADNGAALSLFVAANLKRENELPAGAVDPIFGEDRYSPQFYATAAGTSTCLDVLAKGLDRNNTPLVRDAIGALRDIAGDANLFGNGTGRQPLLECLGYPDRRVQYEAALTLGRALPSNSFPGDHRVVPILASAVRTGNVAYALVIADDDENRRIESGKLSALDFTVLNGGANFESVRGEVDQATGVDLIVIRSEANAAMGTIASIRANPKTAATPVLLVSTATDQLTLQREYSDDPRVDTVLGGTSDEAFTFAVNALLMRASGGRMTDAEADMYAFDALKVLSDIAIASNPVYNLDDAERPLIEALADRSGGVRLVIADVIARMETATAQRALFDTALAASGNEQVEFLRRLATSARHNGNMAEPRHIAALLDLVKNASDDLADAAAEVHGALDLPPSNAVELIVR